METESLIALAVVISFLFLVIAQQMNLLQKLKDVYANIVRYIERIDPRLATTVVLIGIAIVLALISGL